MGRYLWKSIHMVPIITHILPNSKWKWCILPFDVKWLTSLYSVFLFLFFGHNEKEASILNLLLLETYPSNVNQAVKLYCKIHHGHEVQIIVLKYFTKLLNMMMSILSNEITIFKEYYEMFSIIYLHNSWRHHPLSLITK